MSNENKVPGFSGKNVDAVIRSSEARELLHILNQDGGAGISRATEALRSGDYKKAVSCLKPLLESPKSEELLQELNRKLGQS